MSNRKSGPAGNVPNAAGAPFVMREARKASALRVLVDLARHADESLLEQLHSLCLAHEGRLPVRFRLLGDGWQAELTPTRVLGVDPKTLAPAVAALLGPGHVEFIFNGS